MNNFQEIISFKALYNANSQCLKGKRTKKEAIDYQLNLGVNLTDLHYRLKHQKYRIEKYYCFMIHDPKEREIQAISYEDRIVQRAVCDSYLTPLLQRHLYFYNVACRKDKGTSLAMNYLKESLQAMWGNYQNEFYVIKIDIKKFFDSMDHNIIKEKLKIIIADKDMLRLLETIIDSYHHENQKGLPMGNQTSQSFALLYLNDVDHYIKEKLFVKYYVRYMDDMILFVSHKEEAWRLFEEIKRLIELESLILNPKSKIIKMTKGFDFLGRNWRITSTGKVLITIKSSSKKRMINHTKSMKSVAEEGQLQQMISAYNGVVKRTNSYYLFKRLLDISEVHYPPKK
jgi:RNA-directed DNA polymerase